MLNRSSKLVVSFCSTTKVGINQSVCMKNWKELSPVHSTCWAIKMSLLFTFSFS